MAKYCSKCGRTLPDGIEICEICHGKTERHDAALFTTMTAETEIWKEAESEGKKRAKQSIKKLHTHKERIMLYSGAILVVALAVFLVIFLQPYSRVMREIKRGNYESAAATYIEKYSETGSSADNRIGRLAVRAAEDIYSAYENEEIKQDKAETGFEALLSMNLNTEEIEKTYNKFNDTRHSTLLIEKAQRLISDKKYLDAYEVLEEIDEYDVIYDQAKELSDKCLEEYGLSVVKEAEESMKQHDYEAALQLLSRGSKKLFTYGSFSQAIDDKEIACCAEYEEFVLSEAKTFGDMGQYTDSADVIYRCMESKVGQTEELSKAYEMYYALAEASIASDAIGKANEFYRAGDFTAAFTELDTALGRVDNTKTVESAIASLEDRYTSDMIAASNAILGTERENLQKAIDSLNEANEIRNLDKISEQIEKLENLKPVSLVSLAFSEREGEVYRSNGEFKSLKGKSYKEGWIWGGNDAVLSFNLDGEYDIIEFSFDVRRDDEKEVKGSFEIWCDDNLVYDSPEMNHDGEEIPVSLDISGCKTLKIVFHTDYVTISGEGGYCYHGLCDPLVAKNIPDFDA